MDILSVLKKLRTERPMGSATNNGEKLCDFQMTTIEVLLGEGHDAVEIRGTSSNINDKAGDIGDVVLDLGGYRFTGLAVAKIGADNRVSNVSSAYKIKGAREGSTFFVAQYFALDDGVKAIKDGSEYNFNPIETEDERADRANAEIKAANGGVEFDPKITAEEHAANVEAYANAGAEA